MTDFINPHQAAATAACAAYSAEKDRLTALGYKSADRYVMLKDLKAAEDAACKLARDAATKYIKRELDTIIRAGKPARDAAARARSPWKQAKFEAGIK